MSIIATIIAAIAALAYAQSEGPFSLPPSALPTRHITIHGHPVTVRQTFIEPKRQNELTQKRRHKRLGIPPPAAAAPAAAAAAPVYASAPVYAAAPAYSQSSYGPAAWGAAAPAYSAPLPIVAPPPVYYPQDTTPQPIPQPRPNYPLPECYTDSSNFMCCNAQLESSMKDSYTELKTSRPDWKICNIHQVSNRVQLNAERLFNTTFEVVSGAGDYASKSQFYIFSYILAYATARPDAVSYPTAPPAASADTYSNIPPPPPDHPDQYPNQPIVWRI